MGFLLHIHSLLRWVFLFMAIFVLINTLIGKYSKKTFTSQDNTMQLILVSIFDLQFLVGLILYFTSPLGVKLIRSMEGEVMHNPITRFFAVEHLTGMFIALILMHIGRSKSKKALSPVKKHGAFLLFLIIALLVILYSIPWPNTTAGLGRNWF